MITVNGKAYPYSPGMTVGEALLLRGYAAPIPMAVYIGGILVRNEGGDREAYRKRELQDGDELLVIDFMGGG